MAQSDAIRWNKRYQEARGDWHQAARPFLVENARLLPEHGLALDLAMGMGQNSQFLLERGLEVIGVDISIIAARLASQRCPRLMAAVADLEHYRFPPAAFDVILNLYFLERNWFYEYSRLLKPGGVLVFETLASLMRTVKPELNPAHLLEPGELRAAFAGWDILVYREGWVESAHGHQKAVASMIARRPTG